MLKAQASERIFNVMVEKDEDKYYVASVVELLGCHTQAKWLNQLTGRIREAIESCLEVAKPEKSLEFVCVQQLRIKFPLKPLASETEEGSKGCQGPTILRNDQAIVLPGEIFIQRQDSLTNRAGSRQDDSIDQSKVIVACLASPLLNRCGI
jgi:predicted RNase H-like HicB family nuclease